MSWDSVPWFVENGAEHSAQICRVLSFAAFGGREGIVLPGDLEVREMAVPGSGVQMYPGACAIVNRATGAESEMYVGRCPLTLDNIAIAPTDATGPRSDMVIAVVKNPWLAGEPWPDPADPTVGPYIDTIVVSNVASNAKTISDLGSPESGYSAIPLARIDLPASTSVIDQGMIVDLRQLSHVRDQGEFNVVTPTATDTANGAAFTNWPVEANFTVDVPDWATHARILALIGGAAYGAAGNNAGAGWNVVAEGRIQFGGAAEDDYSQAVVWNLSNSDGVDRTTLMIGAPLMPIPAGSRGTSAVIRLEAKKDSGSTDLRVDDGSVISLQVHWTTRPESNV